MLAATQINRTSTNSDQDKVAAQHCLRPSHTLRGSAFTACLAGGPYCSISAFTTLRVIEGSKCKQQNNNCIYCGLRFARLPNVISSSSTADRRAAKLLREREGGALRLRSYHTSLKPLLRKHFKCSHKHFGLRCCMHLIDLTTQCDQMKCL